MKVKIYRESGTLVDDFESDEVVAATRTFPYWVFWESVEDDKVQTKFIHMNVAQAVILEGEKDEAPQKKADLKVVPIKGGEKE